MVKTCAAVEHAASAATRSIGAEGGERGARARAGRAVSLCKRGRQNLLSQKLFTALDQNLMTEAVNAKIKQSRS